MCDYSLEHLASRPATVGDKLVSTKFGDSISRGFRGEVGDPDVAVCLRPGTEIAFDRKIQIESLITGIKTTFPHRTARFRQVDVETQHIHHDALEFPDGDTVLLTKLVPGQRATVLQLPAQPLDVKEQMREHEVVQV